MKPKLDQFYTNMSVSATLVADVLKRYDVMNDEGKYLDDRKYEFVEPSAGTGSFVRALNVQLGTTKWGYAMDIDPKHTEKGIFINRWDFLDETAPLILTQPTIYIGNPPFGKNASLAIKFFNMAAKQGATVIAFIVPKTFRKESVQMRLNPYYRLVHDKELPEDIPFHTLGEDGKVNGRYSVPCAWQIWERRKTKRRHKKTPDVSHLIEYTTPEKAHFAMRRVGFYAGTIVRGQLDKLSLTTHYFIKEVKPGTMMVLDKTDWSAIIENTAGPRSLSKREIALALTKGGSRG